MRIVTPRPTMGFLPVLVAFAGSGAAGAAATAAVVTATGTLDAIGSGVKAVVMSPVGAPFRWLIEGPLRDFAKTTFGKWTLNVIANVAFGPIYNALGGTAVGPFSMLASAVYAVPGVLAGGSFFESWVKGTVDRLAQVLEYFGAKGLPGDLGAKAGDAFAKGIEVASQKLAMLPAAVPREVTAAAAVELARRFQLRPDAVCYALAGMLRSTEWKGLGDSMRLEDGEPGPREVTVAPIKPSLTKQLEQLGSKLAARGPVVSVLEDSRARRAAQQAEVEAFIASWGKDITRGATGSSSSSSRVPLIVGGVVLAAAAAAAVVLSGPKTRRR